MDGRRLRAGLVLVLAVVALGAAGASMSDGAGGGGSTGLGDGTGTGLGSGEDGILTEVGELNPLFDGSYLVRLIGLVAVLGALAGVVGLVLGLVNWDREQFKEILLEYGAKGLALLALAAAAWLLLRLFSPSIGGGSTGLGSGADGEAGGSVSDATGLELPSVIGVAVLVVLLFGAMVLVRRSTAGDEAAAPAAPAAAEAEEPPTPGIDDGGSSTGAGGIPREAADNEVYRAWLALADAAGANARRDTPAAVADRAIEAGVESDAAEEITALFERVRYGDAEADERLERRARRARDRLAEGR